MIATVLLISLLLLATLTDLRGRKIYNWTTYPGLLAALMGSAAATWWSAAAASEAGRALSGFVSFSDSVAGLLACGSAMLVCYVLFPGGVGGGDVKLIAMVGAFLGLGAGLEAMLWTFVFGGCAALIVMVWRFGLLTLAARIVRYVWWTLRLGRPMPLTPEERKPLSAPLHLSPAALAAVLVVQIRMIEFWP